MSYDKRTSQIEKLCKDINSSGLRCKIWRPDRIYINGLGKEFSIFVQMKNPEANDYEKIFDNCELKVYSNADCSIPARISRSKDMKNFILRHFYYSRIVEDNPDIPKPSSLHDE